MSHINIAVDGVPQDAQKLADDFAAKFLEALVTAGYSEASVAVTCSEDKLPAPDNLPIDLSAAPAVACEPAKEEPPKEGA